MTKSDYQKSGSGLLRREMVMVDFIEFSYFTGTFLLPIKGRTGLASY